MDLLRYFETNGLDWTVTTWITWTGLDCDYLDYLDWTPFSLGNLCFYLSLSLFLSLSLSLSLSFGLHGLP